MNSYADAVKVLCYGDSNTWGQTPDKTGRQPADVRWTGILQNKLSDGYYVIEEGLSSRTTNIDYNKKPGRNGKTYLIPCLGSHIPIDIVVLMLGTNDLKTVFDRTAADVARAVDDLIKCIQEHGTYMGGDPPKIIVASPIHIDVNAPKFADFYSRNYNESSGSKSRELAAEIAVVAKTIIARLLTPRVWRNRVSTVSICILIHISRSPS